MDIVSPKAVYSSRSQKRDANVKKIEHLPAQKDRFSIGERNSHAKLTELDVLNIRSSKLRQCQLALAYNINRHHIANIINRKNWKHI